MIRSVLFYAVARVLSGFLLYVTLLVFLYGLTRQEYRYFSAAYPLYQILTLTCFGWIAAIVPPLFAGVEPEAQELAQSRLLRAFAWMCLVAAVALVAARLSGATDVPLVVLAAIGAMTIASSASDDILAVANAREQHRTYLAISAARYGIGLVLASLVLALPGLGAAGGLFGLAIGSAVSVFLWWRRHAIRHPAASPTARPREVAALLAVGLPAIIAFAVYQLSMSASRLIVADTCSLDAAATLGGVNDLLSGPILLVFQVINLAMNPSLYAAANRHDQPALRKVAFTTIGMQLAIIAPGAALLFTVGRDVGALLLSGRLGPLAPVILPYVGLAVLLSVSLNTAVGVALAKRRATGMALFGVLVIALSMALAIRHGCDILGFTQQFTVVMGLSGIAGLALIYWLTRSGSDMRV